MSDCGEHYGDLVLTEELDQILNQPLDATPDESLAREDLVFGSDEYCADYKRRLTEKVQGVTKFTPHDWQLEAALAIHLGRDVFILAGTGFGKTLPFIMNCLLDPTMIVWIVTPLNALANQQARTFTEWKIPSIAVNSTTTHSGIYKDIRDGKYQVIISNKKTGKKAIEAAAKKLVAPSKAKRSPREYTPAILEFINTLGCRMKVLDKEFGNPSRPAPEDPLCLCDNCRHGRGELTLRERLQARSGKRRRSEDEEATMENPQDPQPDMENSEDELEEIDEGDVEAEVQATAMPSKRKNQWRSAPKRKPFAKALTRWRSEKFDSPECEDWDIDEDWILSSKLIKLIARDPRITSMESLALLQPAWTHAGRWGAEVIGVISTVLANQERIEHEKRQAAEEKQRAQDAARARFIEQARIDALEQQR
ncbi:hypothetical protein FS749_006365 [Ceratobasidium sp. UAMH 11750]|nr:hypothetical protein FS749_006365 [Ceratobasidium sp. UAMH 11750]